MSNNAVIQQLKKFTLDDCPISNTRRKEHKNVVDTNVITKNEKNKNRSTCLDKTARRQLADWIGFDGGQRKAVRGHFGKALCFLPVGLRGGGRERKGPLAWFSPALPVRHSVSSRTSTVQELRVALPFHFPPTKKKFRVVRSVCVFFPRRSRRAPPNL